jgi:hypothetical protein
VPGRHCDDLSCNCLVLELGVRSDLGGFGKLCDGGRLRVAVKGKSQSTNQTLARNFKAAPPKF